MRSVRSVAPLPPYTYAAAAAMRCHYGGVHIDACAQLTAVLLPHQVEGVRWMRAREAQGVTGVLGDAMGLGKTVQMIAAVVSDANAGAPPFRRKSVV